MYSNVNGLYFKLAELKNCLADKNIDIACITETHFHENLFDAEINIPGYSIFRHDRDFMLDRTCTKSNANDINKFISGGGSAIYVKEHLNAELITHFYGPDSIAIILNTNIGKILLACFYRSPSLNTTQDKKLLTFFKCLSEYDDDEAEKIFMGDLNLWQCSFKQSSLTENLIFW